MRKIKVPVDFFLRHVKFTVQFETEVNRQNEIVSNMDRLEVKL